MKVNEIARFRERNVRISKIISQLKLEELLVQPSLSDSEQSEKILIVEDREITIKKYISHEEKTRLEEQAQHEEERRLVSMGDNSRERALDMMMRGRLEADMEEDLFKVLHYLHGMALCGSNYHKPCLHWHFPACFNLD